MRIRAKVREWSPSYRGDDYKLEIFTKKFLDTSSYLDIRVTPDETDIFEFSSTAHDLVRYYPDIYYDLFDDLAKALHGRLDKDYSYARVNTYAVIISKPPTMIQFKAIERLLDKYDLV